MNRPFRIMGGVIDNIPRRYIIYGGVYKVPHCAELCAVSFPVSIPQYTQYLVTVKAVVYPASLPVYFH